MSVGAVAVFAAAVLVYVAGSDVLDRWHITAPMVFVVVGAGIGFELLHAPEPTPVRDLAELTLALVLFHDAAELQPRELTPDLGVCARLLFVGLPMTMLSGFLVARWLFPHVDAWFALVLAAALTPTDAGLGAATVLNPVVPVRIRRVLNVESGLNDGLTTPVVLFALSSASSGGHELGSALRELAVGALFGAAIGCAAGYLLRLARAHGLTQDALVPVGTVAVPLLCYYGAVAAEGNGFVAAFVAGTAFAAATGPGLGGDRRDGSGAADTKRHPLELATDGSTLLGYAVWCLFGAILVAHVHEFATVAGFVFAISALTVLRILPVGLVLLGSGFRRQTRLFIGWFGPRGLASVVFALIAVEEYPGNAEVEQVVGAIGLTVLLSVVLHGATAEVGARRYGAWVTRVKPAAELEAAVTPVARRGTRRDWHRLTGTDRRS